MLGRCHSHFNYVARPHLIRTFSAGLRPSSHESLWKWFSRQLPDTAERSRDTLLYMLTEIRRSVEGSSWGANLPVTTGILAVDIWFRIRKWTCSCEHGDEPYGFIIVGDSSSANRWTTMSSGMAPLSWIICNWLLLIKQLRALKMK